LNRVAEPVGHCQETGIGSRLLSARRRAGDPVRPTCWRRQTPFPYLVGTGWPWRALPCNSFPPRSKVYNILRKFQRNAVWEVIHAELHMTLRERLGPEASPSVSVLDSQSVKPAERRGGKENHVGYDAGRQVRDRKIHALVDSGGLPMRVAETRCRGSSLREFQRPMPIISSILAATIANHAAGPARTPLRDFFADPWMRRVLSFSFPSLAAWALFPDRY